MLKRSFVIKVSLITASISLLGMQKMNNAKLWLSFPSTSPELFMEKSVLHYDHDGGKGPAVLGEGVMCTDYAGKKLFPHCYNGHEETDYLLN